MKKFLFLLSFIILTCCSKTTEEPSIFEEMKSDKLMSEHFTKSELKDLAKIVDFFEAEMSKEIDSKLSIESKYNIFLKKDSIIYTKGEMQDFINYEDQKKLYKSIDISFFNNLWGLGKATFYDRNRKEYKVEYYHLKTFNSKYSSFLEEYTKNDIFLKKYYESISISNDFYTPSTPVFLTHYHNKLNKKDIKIRLIYAMHFLNINEEDIRHQKIINENTNTHH